MYHFISGYTAKVSGTERGITEPTPNFSACFGAAFLALHPTRYADLLQEKIDQHGSTAWLVNTGWSGGAYGVGERMSINTTRAIIDAIHDGSAAAADYTQEDSFDLAIPTALNGVDSHVLNPKNAWKDKAEYDQTAKKLAGMFTKNFEKFAGKGTRDYYNYGPKV
jgi:phosphoenolpyruvate carboxykinase (ATP)